VLGEILAGEGRLEEAVEIFRGQLVLDPGFAPAHLDLGLALVGLGRDLEAAARHLREALRLGVRPPHAHAHATLGIVLNRLGDEAGAVEALREAVRQGEARPAVLNTLAWLLVGGRDEALRAPEEAVALARRVCRGSPGEPGALNTLGVALYRAGRSEEAIRALEASRERGGAAACDDFVLAMAHWRLGREAEARRLLARGVARLESHPIEDERAAEDTNRFRAEAEALIEGR
jgi:Flp pilus assembly protein TadD